MMKRRVFQSILLSSMLVLAAAVCVILITVHSQFSEERKAEIRNEATYIASFCNGGGEDFLSGTGKNFQNRITLIAADGTVLYDNFKNSSELDNHADRPEIIAALQNGSGEEVRISDTLGTETFYYAVKLENGNVLRLAATMKSLFSVFDSTATYIFLVVLLALCVSIAAAAILTKMIVAPINKIDIERPLKNNTYDELSPLLVRMDKQNTKINEQINELTDKQNEFATITDGMSEALVIFSAARKVITANFSAERLFSMYSPVGSGYLELCRDAAYVKAVESAFAGNSAEGRFVRNGRIYRLSVTPVENDSSYAAVLFAVDITEAEQAEQMRREFSANVSHELKTPLTSIMGYAEIMGGGIAKPEDYKRFSNKIYDEASRLLALIEDIIRLSKLDEENIKQEYGNNDLLTIAEKATDSLETKAEKNGVTLSVKGEHIIVRGIENVLSEMIFNLCDNAIAYNHSGGSVEVTTGRIDEHPAVTVKDNGIGIAPEHQSRIFERFYRVDKSHSKETGGTGLGLSIVKHGAMLHSAEIRLKSELGKGSEISIVFTNAQ